MKRLVVLILSLLICVSTLFSGCNTGDKNSGKTDPTSQSDTSGTTVNETVVASPGTFPIVKEKTTLRVVTPQKAQIEDYDTNELTKYMEDKTNVHIQWELIPEKDFNQKINLLLAASAELPDVFMGRDATTFDNNMLVLYGSQGIFRPMNDLIDKYGTEIKKVFEAYPDLRKEITAPDGNIYSLFRVIKTAAHVDWMQKFWINTRFLENLNMEIPKTTDEYYEVLKAFKTKDPNKNGKADEIPLAGATTGNRMNPYDFLMCSFIFDDGDSRLTLNNGKVDVAFNKPEWKEGLLYLRKLCEEGLLDPVSFTQDNTQLKQLVENPDALVGSVPGANPAIWADIKGERYKDYTMLEPLKGPNGVQTVRTEASNATNGYFIITSACKEPEVAFRWADWFYSEEASIKARFGDEGVEFDYVSVSEVKDIPADVKKLIKTKIPWGSNQNYFWMINNPTWLKAEWWEYDPLNLYLSSQAQEKYKPYSVKVIPPLFLLPEEVTEYNEMSVNIKKYVDERIVAFIVGQADANKDWDNYIKEFDKLNVGKFVEMAQKAYDRQYK